jgi:hypothetical protein
MPTSKPKLTATSRRPNLRLDWLPESAALQGWFRLAAWALLMSRAPLMLRAWAPQASVGRASSRRASGEPSNGWYVRGRGKDRFSGQKSRLDISGREPLKIRRTDKNRESDLSHPEFPHFFESFLDGQSRKIPSDGAVA